MATSLRNSPRNSLRNSPRNSPRSSPGKSPRNTPEHSLRNSPRVSPAGKPRDHRNNSPEYAVASRRMRQLEEELAVHIEMVRTKNEELAEERRRTADLLLESERRKEKASRKRNVWETSRNLDLSDGSTDLESLTLEEREEVLRG